MAVMVLKIFDFIPVRVNIWVMIFTSCWVSYMLRVNMSLNLIAMVPNKANVTSPSRTFDWSVDKQALILGSYFWSYPITSLIGGMVAERWGPRIVVFLSSLFSAVLTAITPIAATWGYFSLVLIRLLLGLAGGFVYPALHAMIARWAPPAEKGKFVSALMGGTLGTVCTWSITGPLMQKYGWETAFYVPSALTFVWCLVWWYLVSDSPGQHPRMLEAEKKYIKEALGDKINQSKGLPPLKKIAFSIPFWAMVALHYGNLWGLYFVMTAGPKFVSSVLEFNLSSAGAVAALPYLARMIFATIFGTIGDCITAKHLMSTTMIRKSFCLVSHILPGAMLILLVYVGKTAAVSVALITASMGMNGAATLTNLQNHQDLAPNYAGTLYGIANCIGSTAGFFTPMITAYFTKKGDTFENWRPVFFVGASVYIFAAIVFIFLGSGHTQEWNYSADNAEENNGDSREMNGTNAKKVDDKDVKETTISSK